MLPAWAEKHPDGFLIRIQAQPKASRTECVGPHGEPPRLKVRVAAPPVDGEANAELIRFMAKTVGLPKSKLELLRGETSKSKDVLCRGLTDAKLREALSEWL